jgi:hypothetical protein
MILGGEHEVLDSNRSHRVAASGGIQQLRGRKEPDGDKK